MDKALDARPAQLFGEERVADLYVAGVQKSVFVKADIGQKRRSLPGRTFSTRPI